MASTRAYGQPMNFRERFLTCTTTKEAGSFTDVSATAGVQVKNPATGVPAAKSLGVAPVDVDGDGWIDLVVANDTVPNFLFLNQRERHFQGDRRAIRHRVRQLRQHARRDGHRRRPLPQRRQARASPSAISPTR